MGPKDLQQKGELIRVWSPGHEVVKAFEMASFREEARVARALADARVNELRRMDGQLGQALAVLANIRVLVTTAGFSRKPEGASDVASRLAAAGVDPTKPYVAPALGDGIQDAEFSEA